MDERKSAEKRASNAARETAARASETAREAADRVQESSLKATEGFRDYQLKVLSAAQAVSARHMLYPLPVTQIQLSVVNGQQALKQNAGW